MGTIKVKARFIGAKVGDCIGTYGDERRYQGDVFEISDHPRTKEVPNPANPDEPLTVTVPGTVAHFSDNKRKKMPGWMEFVNPEDDKKYRSGGFNPAGPGSTPASAPSAPAAAAPAKPAGKGATGEKPVLG
jgi:hypothetical protein